MHHHRNDKLINRHVDAQNLINVFFTMFLRSHSNIEKTDKTCVFCNKTRKNTCILKAIPRENYKGHAHWSGVLKHSPIEHVLRLFPLWHAEVVLVVWKVVRLLVVTRRDPVWQVRGYTLNLLHEVHPHLQWNLTIQALATKGKCVIIRNASATRFRNTIKSN